MINDNLGNVLAKSKIGLIVALDENRVAKYINEKSFEKLTEESRKMLFANNINNLVVNFLDLKTNTNGDLAIIMERIYPLHFHALDYNTKYHFYNDFIFKIDELHSAGFVHRDLSTYDFCKNPNFILTDKGIRLIDVGMAELKRDISLSDFNNYVKKEKENIKQIKKILLSYEI